MLTSYAIANVAKTAYCLRGTVYVSLVTSVAPNQRCAFATNAVSVLTMVTVAAASTAVSAADSLHLSL